MPLTDRDDLDHSGEVDMPTSLAVGHHACVVAREKPIHVIHSDSVPLSVHLGPTHSIQSLAVL